MDEGQSFGEIGLLCDVKRQANVKATTMSHLCVLRREDFERLSLQHEVGLSIWGHAFEWMDGWLVGWFRWDECITLPPPKLQP